MLILVGNYLKEIKQTMIAWDGSFNLYKFNLKINNFLFIQIINPGLGTFGFVLGTNLK
jgi:hypothetical protein